MLLSIQDGCGCRQNFANQLELPLFVTATVVFVTLLQIMFAVFLTPATKSGVTFFAVRVVIASAVFAMTFNKNFVTTRKAVFFASLRVEQNPATFTGFNHDRVPFSRSTKFRESA